MIAYMYSMYIEDKTSNVADIVHTCKTMYHYKFDDLIREIELDINKMILSEYKLIKPKQLKVVFKKYPSMEEFEFFANKDRPILDIEYHGGIYLRYYTLDYIKKYYSSFIMECNKNRYLFKVDEFDLEKEFKNE